MNDTSNNKRIAKNTIVLYIRMLFLMAVNLYASRVVLDALGVEDYGIYNVVGGVVAMFTMISGSLAAAISRFITYELGKGAKDNLKTVFSSSVIIQIFLSVVFVVIAETVGLWFLNAKLNIPAERMAAANWVFQFSIITFAINLISVPYNAAIIAHEEMSAFAYISIFEGVGKLIVAWIIVTAKGDKMIIYAALIALIAVIVRFVYGFYCKKRFEECQVKFKFEKKYLRQIFSFAGWNMIGAASAVCRDQGGNIIINLFCGPTVNAARGVAMQVNSAINGFVSNFQMALNPQITKNYAMGDVDYMLKLVYQGSRFSFYILWIISLPVLITANYLLSIWLVEVPEHATVFLQLVIIFSLSESLSGPLMTAMYATGKVRNYQIIVGGLQLLNLPLSYLCLYVGLAPEFVFVVAILLSAICMLARLIMLHPLINISPLLFIKRVWFNTIIVAIISLIPVVILTNVLKDSFFSFLIIVITCILISSLTILYIGCSKDERALLFNKCHSIILKVVSHDNSTREK